MTPELAAEQAAATLTKAAEQSHFPEEAAALVAVADGWTRLHTALANAPKVDAATPDENYELGIDKIMRRNEELKRATEPTLFLSNLPGTPDQYVTVGGNRYQVRDWGVRYSPSGNMAEITLKGGKVA
ncbi:hypothetical protein [Nonomuraea dietziae]|uniref:hypothetical protein n=1 Tax=Nonomuraea dietziae TaxID=65515 RepID=UPI0033E5B195